ncbi:nucleotidyltransferase domain-containing protein [Aeromonas hydrophila]
MNVFGSRECGDYGKYSEVDLAVIAPSFTKTGANKWVALSS